MTFSAFLKLFPTLFCILSRLSISSLLSKRLEDLLSILTFFRNVDFAASKCSENASKNGKRTAEQDFMIIWKGLNATACKRVEEVSRVRGTINNSRATLLTQDSCIRLIEEQCQARAQAEEEKRRRYEEKKQRKKAKEKEELQRKWEEGGTRAKRVADRS